MCAIVRNKLAHGGNKESTYDDAYWGVMVDRSSRYFDWARGAHIQRVLCQKGMLVYQYDRSRNNEWARMQRCVRAGTLTESEWRVRILAVRFPATSEALFAHEIRRVGEYLMIAVVGINRNGGDFVLINLLFKLLRLLRSLLIGGSQGSHSGERET